MLNKARAAVLVSGGGTNLQALIDAGRRGEMPSVKLTLVASSNPDAYALTRAKDVGIDTFVAAGGDESVLLSELKKYEIDIIILAGYLKILSSHFISSYPDRIINVHPSLIPSFCGKGYYGLKVHEAALNAGVKVTGATVHIVNEIPDGGRILLQKAVEVKEDDTPKTLQKRVMEQTEWVLLPKAAEKLCREYIQKRETETTNLQEAYK